MDIKIPKFICHSDFESLVPINVFHKQHDGTVIENSPKELQNRHVLFRKKFNIDEVETAVMKITADDYYKLYINGVFVTQGPASAYPSAYYYNEIDVSEYLVSGENVIAVHTYYQGLINRVWVSGDKRQMMWMELKVNEEIVLVSDETWLCHCHGGYAPLEIIGYDTAFNECYDANSMQTDFYKSDFDDSAWSKACIYKNADYKLSKQPTKQLSIYETEPMIKKDTTTGIFCDFGREIVGYVSLTVKGNKGDVVTIRAGEELDSSGDVRYDMRCGCVYEDKLILSGKEDEFKQFDYKAFRYVEIILPEGAEIIHIGAVVRHYPFIQVNDYNTDNPKLKAVLDLCRDTVKYGVQEGFLDCPTREKGQYMGDATVTARAHATLTGDTALMKKAILEFCEGSFICPGLMAVSGSSLMQEIADYSLQLPAQIAWVYSLDGDKDFLRLTEPYVTGMLSYFKKYMNEAYLLERVDEKWNLVDWPDNLRDGYDFDLSQPIGNGLHNVINAFWCGFLSAIDEIYLILGKSETGLTEKAKSSFINFFYNKETHLFCDNDRLTHSAVHSNILPLLFDIGINDENRNAIVTLIREKGLHSMGVYMAYFALAALKTAGETELAVELATDERCWINMIREGATTTFEAWGKEQKWNTSLCHPWATAPIVIFSDKVRPY